jgi:tetratricopeptide (TPR) repeat protein
MAPELALQTVIRAVDRALQSLPNDLAQLQAIYTSALDGKHMLILADDAKDKAQVELLLPPHSCTLLVTSRQHFTFSGMTALDLGALPEAEAVALLQRICERLGGENVAKLARFCGYMPLALRVSASVLANDVTLPVARYLEHLEHERLALLRDPDDPDNPDANVEASLRLSYDALDTTAQSALCQLSVFAAPFDLPAGEAVVVLPVPSTAVPQVEAILGLLYRRSLLEWDVGKERYRLHDLVQAFAATRLSDADPVRQRHAQYYVQVANHAEQLYMKGSAGVPAGLALFDQERVHIDAGWDWALAHAGDPSADALLLAYAKATANTGNLRYDPRRARIPQLATAVAAAQRLGDRWSEGRTLGNLGNAYANLGEKDRAIEFSEQALAIAQEVSDRWSEGRSLSRLGNAFADLGDSHRAIEFSEQALAIARELDVQRSEEAALDQLENAYVDLGDSRRAIELFEQALAIWRELGDRREEGRTLSSQGVAHADLGDVQRAIKLFEQALAIARERGDRWGEGVVLGRLGNAYINLGNVHRAIELFEQALAIARELGAPRGEEAALDRLGNAYANLGDSRRAIELFEQALAIAREQGDQRGEALTSCNLGRVLKQQGDQAQAATLMQISVDYLRTIEHPTTETYVTYLVQVQKQLHSKDSQEQ